MMKLVVDARTDKVLGCHIFGPEAGEMVQLVAIALKIGATKAQFDDTVSVHPDDGRRAGDHPQQALDPRAIGRGRAFPQRLEDISLTP